MGALHSHNLQKTGIQRNRRIIEIQIITLSGRIKTCNPKYACRALKKEEALLYAVCD
jgi:hypothetical protein